MKRTEVLLNTKHNSSWQTRHKTAHSTNGTERGAARQSDSWLLRSNRISRCYKLVKPVVGDSGAGVIRKHRCRSPPAPLASVSVPHYCPAVRSIVCYALYCLCSHCVGRGETEGHCPMIQHQSIWFFILSRKWISRTYAIICIFRQIVKRFC